MTTQATPPTGTSRAPKTGPDAAWQTVEELCARGYGAGLGTGDTIFLDARTVRAILDRLDRLAAEVERLSQPPY
jgi:hypothetical protein